MRLWQTGNWYPNTTGNRCSHGSYGSNAEFWIHSFSWREFAFFDEPFFTVFAWIHGEIRKWGFRFPESREFRHEREDLYWCDSTLRRKCTMRIGFPNLRWIQGAIGKWVFLFCIEWNLGTRAQVRGGIWRKLCVISVSPLHWVFGSDQIAEERKERMELVDYSYRYFRS